jgi:hypothetical protein
MTRKFVPVEQAFAEWRRDPLYRAAYDSLEDEFRLASALSRRVAELVSLKTSWLGAWARPRRSSPASRAGGSSHRRARSNASPRRQAPD